MNSLAAITIALGVQVEHSGIIDEMIFLSRKQQFLERVAEQKRLASEQRRQIKKRRTRYLRAVKAARRRGNRLIRQANGQMQALGAMEAQAARRAHYYRTGR